MQKPLQDKYITTAIIITTSTSTTVTTTTTTTTTLAFRLTDLFLHSYPLQVDLISNITNSHTYS